MGGVLTGDDRAVLGGRVLLRKASARGAARADGADRIGLGRHAGAVVDKQGGAAGGCRAEVRSRRLGAGAGELSGREAALRWAARGLEPGGREGQGGRQDAAESA